MTFKRLMCLFMLPIILCTEVLNAQVTSSTIIGTVKDNSNATLEGASVTATHNPSGTVYTTVTKKGGAFTLPNVRVGGPYTVVISYSGYANATYENINLALGENYNLTGIISKTSSTLTNVVVSGTKRAGAIDKSGTSTNIGQRQLTTLPTISRSITDFTRLTPQANGNSFGGRDGRMNNITVDGANLNNNFGLSTDALPGGGHQPISLDAVEQVTVNITPYDVRQANFTGANIAAVTKSGTNTFKGSLYGFYRNQDFIGDKVGKDRISSITNTNTKIYGGTLGGPIIKNKLFFFVNAEVEKRITPPGTSYTPKGGSGTGNISNTPVDSLRKLSDYLRNTYGYETGSYDNFPNFTFKNHKLLGKIDWNITKQHRLTAKYNEVVGDNDVALNSLSVPNGATAGVNPWTSTARFGTNAMSFANSNYAFRNVVRSAALELNSTFNSQFSNQIIASYTRIQTTRTSPSSLFPFIDIIGDPTKTGLASTYAGGARNNYMSVGYEPYSYNNDVKNNIFNVTDNFTWYKGRHTVTAGLAYEHQYVGNQFMAASQSYYVYGSLADFMNPNAHPIAFGLTFSRVPGVDAPYSAEMKIGQGSAYLQDEINITSNFRLSLGFRVDKPIYDEQPLENPSITALTFPDRNGNPTNYSTGMWPKATAYLSPRLNARWDIGGQKSFIVRGGAGIYTGRLPYVYLTNMPTNSGMYQVSALASAAQLAQITFKPDPKAWQSLFTAPTPTPNTAGFVLIDKNFKFPQVFRINGGVDKTLGAGFTATVDGFYTKDLNAVVMRNANELTPTGTVNLGGSSRPSFTSTSTAVRRKYNAYANAIVLENAKGNGGETYVLTAQLSKSFASGFYGTVAYTYTKAKDFTANPGSTASSTWSVNPTSGTQNTLEYSYSNFNVPHRLVASLSYHKEYLKHFGSTISIFYEGMSQGSFSYLYGAASGTAPTGFANTADINYDGNSSDLMYIPKNASEITFVPLTIGGTTYTAQQQSDAFFKFVAQDKYLSKHQGEVAQRNAARYPFYHQVDFRFLQDIFVNVGKRRNTIQLSFDCLNVLNLLSSSWGNRDFYVVNNPLRATKNATTGEVRYQMATYTPTGSTTTQLVDRTFIKSISTSSTYSFQLGLRYIFN